MPTDIDVDSNFDSTWNEVGDLSTVEGPAYVRQSLVIAIQEGVDLRAPALTPTAVEETRGGIAAVVRNHPFTRGPTSVTVETHDEDTLVFEVSTARVTLTVPAE